MSRYEFIAVEKARHSVVRLCRVLGVAKSAFYVWQQHQPSEKRFSGKTCTIQRQRRRRSDKQGKNHSDQRDYHAVQDRVPDGVVFEQYPIPMKREVARRESTHPRPVE